MAAEQRHQYWQQHIEAWRQSALSQRDYCKRQEISFSGFSYWRRRLNGLAKDQSKLLPIKVSRSATLTVILPSGIRLELPAHALEEILPVLIRAVQE